ncbi:hypothetical protein [Dactylosporangium sp. NPDC049140]|uniref:DUF4760 domain-containing protein n=1 Tax=Dactylosporangium sp. NPDC049140 TaxID=3155647 RepID=UPI0033E26552
MALSDLGTVGLSMLALAVSVASAYMSRRQVTLQDKATHAGAVVTILAQFRDPKLHESFECVFNELPGHDAELGLGGLPAGVRNHTYNVCYFLNEIGSMLTLGILREDAFLAIFRARAIAVWGIVGPFVEREREINARVGPEFLAVVEALAHRAAMLRPDVGRGILREWLERPIGKH